MSRREKNDLKQNRKRDAASVAASAAGGGIFDDARVDLSCFDAPEPMHLTAKGWSSDFCELAERIYNEGENTVSNRVRDLLAKGLPFGCATPRDGISIAPQMT